MRVVLQRVTSASVTINSTVHAKIDTGFLLLLGIENEDTEEDIIWLTNKINSLRLFNDENDLMNLSIQDVGGAYMVISQFTLFAKTKKGNRPSFIRAARPEIAIPLYEKFISVLNSIAKKPVKSGLFGANMEVALVNDGPVTLIIDSKNRE